LVVHSAICHPLATPKKEENTQSTMEHPGTVAARLTGAPDPDKQSGLTSKVGHMVSRMTGLPPPVQDSKTVITDNFGHPLPSLDHALQMNGRVVSSDTTLFEKQQTFNRAKTLERMVHPAGSGAFGYFEVTQDLTQYCKAKLFSSVGKQTPVFTRFSTVTFGREFPDAGRNPRGFAIKFYTEDGNYDLVGLNWPIFFVRDPMKGPDVIRSQQRNPENFLLNAEGTIDFLAANPEALHAGAMFFSDSGTPVGWRHMDGFGCHTFKWVNADGDSVYVKYHFVPEVGKKNFTWDEAVRMSGVDPDFAKRDLWEHIASGNEARWTASVQIMTEDEANTVDYDPFDVTKVWSHADFPLHELGKLVLNKNPENYHRDVEQAAMNPGNLVPGIEPSPDLLLNWRMFFYRDAQFHRLGVNHHQIPVNCPFMARYYSPQSRDGLGRADANGVGISPYSATGEARRQQVSPDANWLAIHMAGTLNRGPSSRHEGKDSEYDQVRQFFKEVLDDVGREHLYYNTAAYLRFCSDVVKKEYLTQLEKIDPAYCEGVETMTAKMPKPTACDLYKQVVDKPPKAP
jgi:catalase